MTDLLDQIDASLEEVEEQLLDEFDRIRNTPSADRVTPIDAGVKTALTEVVLHLHDRLEHSGDVNNLQLLSERHEVLYARIAVLRQLLKSSIPRAYLEEAHEGVQSRRRSLELRVVQQRTKSSRDQAPVKSGSIGAIREIADRKPTPQAVARNRIKVTAQEEKALAHTQIYLDNGVYSASRELAMVASVMRGGTLDRPPEATGNQPQRGKASFESRELSNTIAATANVRPVAPRPIPRKPGEVAQTPEEIRRKLEARGQAGATRPASFGARDIEPAYQAPPPKPTPPSPEPKSGKATFSSRDIKPEFESEPPRRREPPPPPPAPEPPRTGRAVFAAKDIEPEVPPDPPRRRPPPEPAEPARPRAEEKPTSGRAVFEARDLSKKPFPDRN